jgi:hypothetical protein
MRNSGTDRLGRMITEEFRCSGKTMAEFYEYLKDQPGVSLDCYSKKLGDTMYYSVHIIMNQSEWKGICEGYVNVYGYEDDKIWYAKS